MDTQPDPELQQWQRQWQAQDVVSPDLRRRVEREIRMERVGKASAIAVTIIFGLGAPAWAVVSRREEVAVLAAAVWVFLAAAWMATRRLGPGSPGPVAPTSAAYVEYSIQTCQRRRSAIGLGAALYVAIIAFDLTWIYRTRATAPGVMPFLVSRLGFTVLLLSLVAAALGWWRRQKLSRELTNLRDLRHQLRDSHTQKHSHKRTEGRR